MTFIRSDIPYWLHLKNPHIAAVIGLIGYSLFTVVPSGLIAPS